MADDTLSAQWDGEAERFDDAADHGLRDPVVRQAWSELLLPLIGPAGQRVADLGCGTGSLSVLLAGAGHHVTGLDFSTEMIRRAEAKADAVTPQPTFLVADAADPPLGTGGFDVVLSRHVLWAMPDPAAAVGQWVRLLRPDGRLLLIEGDWVTGAGLSAAECSRLVRQHGDDLELRRLDDPNYWGGPITDERYLIISLR
jgi:ubiquinone/menaquinone biosynthesis C-methylase UbiE